MSAMALAQKRNLWLVSAKFDLTFLVGSAVLAAVPLSLYYVFGVSTTAINYLVAALVGGPHLYSTYGLNFIDGSFRKRFPAILWPSLVIPPIVLFLALNNLTLLLTIFFFSASLHVLHQLSYLADSYRHKDARPRSAWNRLVDYGLIFTGLYPVASQKLIAGEFYVANRVIPLPAIAKQEWIPWAVTALFAGFAVAFVVKTVKEYREDRFNLPATVLIVTATVVSMLIPRFSNLDVAFQGYNTWHSFQYLALVWLMLKLRREHGELDSRLMARTSPRAWSFYGLNLGFTAAAVALIFGLQYGLKFEAQAAYYSVVLGSLLIHYYLDFFNFRRYGQLMSEPSARQLGLAARRAA
jgi:hypothetical protein